MAADSRHTEYRLRVDRVSYAADGVVLIDLVDPDGRELAAWEAGSHLEIALPSGTIRHYSLCGLPDVRDRYTVAVLRVPDGRGGSIEIHDRGLVGRQLCVRGPRNNFRLGEAERYLLLAGGIGITPIIAMARALESQGKDWRLVYGGRSRGAMPFRSDLVALAPGKVDLVPQDEAGFPDFQRLISDAPSGTAVYCCGPPAMLGLIEELVAERAGEVDLIIERFGPTEAVEAGRDGDRAFDVELRQQEIVIRVEADQTVLEAVSTVIADHPYSCLAGQCGSCETRVLAGEIDHRDEVLREEEKASNTFMMICVSRAISERLTLDL